MSTTTQSRTVYAAQAPAVSEVLFKQPSNPFSSMQVLPSNIAAVEAGLHFIAGNSKFGAVIGPSGWGKSHVLDCVCDRLRRNGSRQLKVISATEWLAGPAVSDPGNPLLLDDVQEATQKPRLRIQLRVALERRIRAGRPTLLAYNAPKRTRHLNAVLPSTKDWWVGVIAEPAPDERMLVISHLARIEGLTLSNALTKLVAWRMRGNGNTLVGALKRLRLTGALWRDVAGTLKACGILEPFFADSGSWDLPRHILTTAKSFPADHFRVEPKELVAFTMLKEACLCEATVARALRISPGEAYQRAARFESRYGESDLAARAVREFAESVVEGLLRE